MKRILIGAVFGAILIAGAILLILGPRDSLRTVRDARALAALPHRAVADMVQLDTGSPDLIVFQDSDAGWFELDTQSLPPGIEIGFHGPRLIDMLGGGAHVSVYCGGSGRAGKILWVVQDGQIARDFAFCNPRRMDLGPLRAFAEPVEMVTQDLTRPAILDLADDIANDPTRALVSRPNQMTPFTERVVITPPLTWYFDDGPPFRHEVEEAIVSRLSADLGDVSVTLRRRPETNPNLSYSDLNVSGMAMRTGDGVVIVPGVRGEPMEIWVECHPEVCARVAALPFDGLFDSARDLARLQAAIPRGVALPDDRSPNPIEWFPTLADLEAADTQIAAPTSVTYQVRFIQRP